VAVEAVARRAVGVGVVVTAVAATVVAATGRPWSALALTATSSVAMINGLWLEGLFARVLQPGRPRITRSAIGILAARMVLWGGLLSFVYLLRERVELWSVAAGMGCFLVGLVVAGMQLGDGG
jgi:hypothetical protein